MFRKIDRNRSNYIFFGVLVIIFLVPLFITDISRARADSDVGGPIFSDTTWTIENSPYIVIANVDVWENVTLTIEPGVVVKFNYGYKLQVNGELIANGTTNSPITFTSNQNNPKKGDWNQIEFTSTATPTLFDSGGNYISGSILKNCVIEYTNADSAIKAQSILIDDCVVRHNKGRGIYNTGSQTFPNRIINNEIYDNGPGSSHEDGGGIYATFSTISYNDIHDNTANDEGGGIFASNSEISYNNIYGNSSYAGGGISASGSLILNNVVTENSIDGYFGGGIDMDGSDVISNTVTNNLALGTYSAGGGIYAYRSPEMGGGTYSVIGNNVVGNYSSNSGGGIYANLSFNSGYSAEVSDNYIVGNTSFIGGGLRVTESRILVSDNYIAHNTGYDSGGGIDTSTSYMEPMISANVIMNNSSPHGAGINVNSTYTNDQGGLYYNAIINNSPGNGIVVKAKQEIHYNTIYRNSPYDLVVKSAYDVNGINNYWGTGSSVDIQQQVYDWYDDNSLGKLVYIPYFQDPDPNSAIIPPSSLVFGISDDQVTLSWDPHSSFGTGWGYKVYYDSDSPYQPYNGIGLPEGNSPIDVGALTSYTLTNLDQNKDYFFVVTTYDNSGHESWYSNITWKQGGFWIYLPIVTR